MKKTVLYDSHTHLNAHMAPFGDFIMPIRYSRVIEEHHQVRNSSGLFDVSHMGQVFVSGRDSGNFLQGLTINDINRLNNGQGQYTAICNHQGGLLDDLIIYRLTSESYLICVNAANITKDYSWLVKHQPKDGVEIDNASDQFGQLALQGPLSLQGLQGTAAYETARNLAYSEIGEFKINGKTAWVARTGYTGEKGYELYIPKEEVVETWESILKHPEVKPIGLGARDTLRLEASYLLYGSDMDEQTTPLEAGIAWATRMDKGDFIGRDALLAQKEEGIKRRLVCFSMLDKKVARAMMSIYDSSGQKVGTVKSASVLPTVGKNGGFALMEGSWKVNDLIAIDIRGERHPAVIEKRPLYQAKIRE